MKPSDLFLMDVGAVLSKRELYDLVVRSKVLGSESWEGSEWVINNTPQQGIHWVGDVGDLRCAIVKAKSNSYVDNGWSEKVGGIFRYALKATNGVVKRGERANQALIRQPEVGYPVLLLLDHPDGWEFFGEYDVRQCDATSVLLAPRLNLTLSQSQEMTGLFPEGARTLRTHLVIERSGAAVKAAKELHSWCCEICGMSFDDRYGVEYIEAHHVVPLGAREGLAEVSAQDFVMLCANCHRVVHRLMVGLGGDYFMIRAEIVRRLALSTSSSPL